MRRITKNAGKLIALSAAAFVLTGMQPRTGDIDGRILDAHNRERALMGVPALRWNDDLANGAQAWADHLSATGQFEHSPNVPGKPPEGENIWGGTPGAFRLESMVGLWIAEKQYFVEGTFPANSSTGRPQDVAHYTQLIWSRSGEVGCGLSSVGQEEILVCRYSEPGNVRGRDPFARPKPATYMARPRPYSDLSVPFASSAASFDRPSSAAMGAVLGASEKAPGASITGAPASSSATRRGDFGIIFGLTGKASGASAMSFISSSCGWSASGCSWLTD
jgi:hypothetical protein